MRKLTKIRNGNGLLNTLPRGKFKSAGIRNELILRKQQEGEMDAQFPHTRTSKNVFCFLISVLTLFAEFGKLTLFAFVYWRAVIITFC